MGSFAGNVLASIVGGIVLVLLGLFAPQLWAMASGLVKDVPRINDRWLAKYTEPVDKAGNTELVQEEFILKQIGRLVWGESRVLDDRNRQFKVSGRLIRGTFTGSVRRKDRDTPAGTGTFQVQVDGNDRTMTGWCTWHDSDTDRIEASQYEWTRMASR